MKTLTLKRAALIPALLLLAGCAVQTREEAERAAREALAEEQAGEPAAEPAIAAPAAPGPEKHLGRLNAYVVSARASSDEGNAYVAECAFDGSLKTRWSSVFQDGEWIEARFDRPVGVREITIRWETARAADFTISLLDGKSKWVEVGRRTGASGPDDNLTLPFPVTAQALRIACLRRATEWGNSIIEVEISGTAEGPPPEQNLLGFKVKPTPWQTREREITERLLAEAAADPLTSDRMTDDQLLDLIEKRAFYFFWYETNPTNGLTKDRGRNFESSEEVFVSSVASVGFALTAYPIGAERGWVSREEALERTKITLRTFQQGLVTHVNGFLPHFVNLFTGVAATDSEISTIDTALFLAGAITAMEYFQDPDVSAAVKDLFGRVDWDWARNANPHFVTHGLDGRGNFINQVWGSMTEGLLIYLLALGSPTHPLPAASWDAIDRHKADYAGFTFVVEHGGQSIFRYQYPALWYDFRGRTDRSGLDYFENATLATLAMRAYCIEQAKLFPYSYGPDSWGLGAADGPDNKYYIYGFPPGEPYSATDGTIVPYAIAGSTPFLPMHAIRALRHLYDVHHELWGKYGFADSANPTQSFVARDALGLDQGTILVGIENYRSRFVWRLFMKNPWVQETTRRIGWQTRPRPMDADGPVDLARSSPWRLQMGGGLMSSPALDDSQWTTVVVPDFWENAGGSFKDYDGTAWYRAAFDLDAERLTRWGASGRPIVLTMGGVDDTDIAYVNGVKVGETLSGADLVKLVRRYRVPGAALKPGRNVVAVQVSDGYGNGGIWRTPVEIGPE